MGIQQNQTRGQYALSCLTILHVKLRQLLTEAGYLVSLYEGERGCEMGFVCTPTSKPSKTLEDTVNPVLLALAEYCAGEMHQYTPDQPVTQVRVASSGLEYGSLVVYLMVGNEEQPCREMLSLRFPILAE